MNKLFWCGALAAALLCSATPASAGDLNLTIANGRVTLIAQDVTVRQILAEWARVGETQILNGDKMLGGPVTLELRDVPEAKALDIVLRSAAGYILAPRLAGQNGVSEYGKIMILATSQPPPVSAAPPTFNTAPRPMPQQFMPVPVNPQDDSGESPNTVPTQPVPGQFTQPEMHPDPQQLQPGQQMAPGQQMPQGPITAPQPGPLPQQPTAPGAVTPGTQQFPTQPGLPRPGVPPPPRRPGGGGEL